MDKWIYSRVLILALSLNVFVACGGEAEENSSVGGDGNVPVSNPAPPTVFPLPGGDGQNAVLGLLENHFQGGVNSTVRAAVRTSDGKLTIVGSFSKRIKRYNSDGSVDSVFESAIGSGANNEVLSIIAFEDDSVIIGGRFSSFNGVTAPRLARIRAVLTRCITAKYLKQ